MTVTIKPMETAAETEGKAYVHWKSWQEAYPGLVGEAYLKNVMTLEKCVQIAFRWPDNVLVAKDGERVVGFTACGPCRDGDLPETGELFALYTLRECYGTGVGRALMEAAQKQLSDYKRVVLWVLEGNGRAIRFYEKCGFRPDGVRKPINLGRECTELRMTHTSSP